MQDNEKIRQPNVAGLFYSKDKEELKSVITGFLMKKKNGINNLNRIKAIIVPHAGYEYSGAVAGQVYNLIKNCNYKKIILLGPSHHYPFRSIALDDCDCWRTPLGKVKLDKKIGEVLLNQDKFQLMPMVFEQEHSLEVQLPWLQVVLGDFTLLPLGVGQNLYSGEIAQSLNKILNSDTLVVVSSDLSHYLPEDEANRIDKNTLDNILRGKSDGGLEACGSEGILILMELAKMNNWKPKLVDYRTSGDVTGEREAVVGYGGIVYS